MTPEQLAAHLLEDLVSKFARLQEIVRDNPNLQLSYYHSGNIITFRKNLDDDWIREDRDFYYGFTLPDLIEELAKDR